MRTSAAIVRATRSLASASEAKTLLAHVLDVEPGRLPLIPSISDAHLSAFDAIVERRVAGEPLHYLTGRAFFRTICVEVGPGVFIPRPETELLVSWAIDRLRMHTEGRDQPLRVVELCAGSGAISKALATEFPDAVFWAVELSDEAWPYLVTNLAERPVTAVHADMADALSHLDGTVDLVIANPPYVPLDAKNSLPADVLAEPHLALFSGDDGLDALKTVARTASRLLRPGGWLCSEHDDTQGTSAPPLLTAAGFVDVVDQVDLVGRPRFVTGRTPKHLAG